MGATGAGMARSSSPPRALPLTWEPTLLFTSRRSRTQLAAVAALLLAVWLFVIPSKRVMNFAEPARSILAEADSWTLYALEPRLKRPVRGEAPYFHHYEIIGEATVSNQALRSKLTEELNWGMLSYKLSPSLGKLCFNPRHGIRAETAEGMVDVVICFNCLRLRVYRPGAAKSESKGVTEYPRAAFNEIFEGAGLSIAP